MRRRHGLLAMLLASAVLAVSCVAPAGLAGVPAPSAMVRPTLAAQTPTGEPQQLKLNLDEIFPPGEGRDLVLLNCVACHGFVRIVRRQKEEARWKVIKQHHRQRVIGLSDEEFNTLFAYLVENFNSTKPVPKLPKWYLESEGYQE